MAVIPLYDCGVDGCGGRRQLLEAKLYVERQDQEAVSQAQLTEAHEEIDRLRQQALCP